MHACVYVMSGCCVLCDEFIKRSHYPVSMIIRKWWQTKWSMRLHMEMIPRSKMSYWHSITFTIFISFFVFFSSIVPIVFLRLSGSEYKTSFFPSLLHMQQKIVNSSWMFQAHSTFTRLMGLRESLKNSSRRQFTVTRVILHIDPYKDRYRMNSTKSFRTICDSTIATITTDSTFFFCVIALDICGSYGGKCRLFRDRVFCHVCLRLRLFNCGE